jgi:hypothetical protein
MNVAVIAQLLPVIAGIFLSFGQTFIKGNKKYVIAIVAYFALKWIADKAALEAAKDSLQGEIDPATGNPTNPNYTSPAELARQYKAAFDPYNTGWLPYNGTDTEALYKLAGKTFVWSDVRSAYKTLYGRDLIADLESELSSSELQNFYDILNRR